MERCLKDDERWEAVVNAPVLLYDLFNELSNAKVEYRKTEHSVALTEWLLTNRPVGLDELFSFIRALVPTE